MAFLFQFHKAKGETICFNWPILYNWCFFQLFSKMKFKKVVVSGEKMTFSPSFKKDKTVILGLFWPFFSRKKIAIWKIIVCNWGCKHVFFTWCFVFFFINILCTKFADMRSKYIYSILNSSKNAYSIAQITSDLVKIKQNINTQYNENLNQNSELTISSSIC